MNYSKKLALLILAASIFQLCARNRGIDNENHDDCFMNASTQALANVPDIKKSYTKINSLKNFQESIPLTTFFSYINKLDLTDQELEKLNTKKIMRSSDLALHGSRNFRAYWTDPNNYTEAKNNNLRLLKHGHCDAQEFISAMLDILNFYFNKVIRESGNNQIKNPINSFDFKFVTRVKRNCGHDTFRIDETTMLKLEIPEIEFPETQVYPDLIDYLNKYSETENMYGLECEECPKKNDTVAHVDGKKFIKLFILPKILMISFCRFAFGGMEDKIDTAITFPDKLTLDKNSSILDENITEKLTQRKIIYHLFAIVCHSGGTGGGHYWAYAKDEREKWYKYDDESFSLTPININEIANQNEEEGTPYILFYKLKYTSQKFIKSVGLLNKEKRLKPGAAPIDDKKNKKAKSKTGRSIKAIGKHKETTAIVKPKLKVVKSTSTQKAARKQDEKTSLAKSKIFKSELYKIKSSLQELKIKLQILLKKLTVLKSKLE